FYPVPKRPIKTLLASNGRSYGQPRWFADDRRVLLTRWAPRRDGTLRPDLYIWDTESGDVDRVTHGAGILNADPHPNGHEAVAMQCHAGHCDIARVDLARGAATTLLQADARHSYYRPRYSPDGSRFVASVNDGGQWRIVVADRDGSNRRVVDPGDGANRYDAQWLRGTDSLVVVSELGGIPNLELLNIADASARTLTRVTGAAVGPDVSPTDGSIWFLTMHSRGLDVRRMTRQTPRADTVVAITADRFGFAGLQSTKAGTLAAGPLAPSRAYGVGPRHQRWLPGGYYSADGAGGFVTVFGGDIVGRLNATATVTYGEPGTWQGGSVTMTWRHPRPAIELGAQGFLDEPSLGRHPQALADSLDATAMQSFLALSGGRLGDGWRVRGRLGGGAGRLDPDIGLASYVRGLGFAEMETQLSPSTGAQGFVLRLRGHATRGHTRARYQRLRTTLEFETTGRDAFPIQLSGTFARLMAPGSPHPFELLSM